MNREAFPDDEKTKSAVVLQLEILGETSKFIPYEIRYLVPDLHYDGIAGMHDRLVHAYFCVDYDRVWDTIENKLPILEKN